MRSTTRLLLSFALLLPLAGCVSSSDDPTIISEETKSSSVTAEMEIGRTLQILDRQVDKVVSLRSQPGQQAFAERKITESALRAAVGQNTDALLAVVADRTEPGRRRIAAKALAYADDPRVVPALAMALSAEPDSRVLVNALYALATIRSADTPTRPVVELASHVSADVRNHALMVLSHVILARRRAGKSPLDTSDRQLFGPALELSLFDPQDPFVRGHAAACAGALGDPRLVDTLLNLLRDSHPFVRTRTAIALSRIGDLKAMPALASIIDDTPRGSTRSAVVTALEALVERSGNTVPPTLGESEASWKQFLRNTYGR